MGKSRKITIGVIPARFGSTRLPGKPLLEISGKPMIMHVYEKASKARLLDRVMVATDDPRILDAVTSGGGEAVMTSEDCVTGTDRILEAITGITVDYVVNIQGDEPMIRPDMIDCLLDDFLRDTTNPETGTLATSVRNMEEFTDPHTVKVVVDNRGYALYFSRAPIPYFPLSGKNQLDNGPVHADAGDRSILKHIGVYVFRIDFLATFTKLPRSFYEKTEKLEQLRILENGYRIKVVETPFECVSVDTREDYQFVCQLFKSHEDLL